MKSLQDLDWTMLIIASLLKWGEKFGKVLYVREGGGGMRDRTWQHGGGGLVFC